MEIIKLTKIASVILSWGQTQEFEFPYMEVKDMTTIHYLDYVRNQSGVKPGHWEVTKTQIGL